jgi:hypothetical protein
VRITKRTSSDAANCFAGVVPVLLAAAIAAGCHGESGGDHAFEEYVEGGIPIAANTGGPLFPGELFRYEQVVTLRQDADQPASLLHGRTRFAWDEPGFLMDEEGRFYVKDGGNTRIAAFDQDGRFERSIGRQGQGPGEWSESFELYGLTDGVLEVYDPGPRRLTYYRTDGTLLEIVQAPVPGFIIHHDRKRNLFTVIGGGTEIGQDVIRKDMGFRTVDAGGEAVGSARTEMVPVQYAYPWQTRTGVGWSPEFPYSPLPFGKYVPDGSILLVAGADPVVWWHWADGSLRKKVTLDLPELRVTRMDREAYLRELQDRADAADDPVERERFTRLRQHARFPEFRAYWESLTVGDEGYIWLQALESDRERQEPGGGTPYYLLSPVGEFIGTTRAPAVGRVMHGHFLGRLADPNTGREDYVAWRLVPRPVAFSYR